MHPCTDSTHPYGDPADHACTETITERTVYGARIGAHWAFVVSRYSDLLRFAGETTTMDYPCAACGTDQMRLACDAANGWWMVCDGCSGHHLVAEMPARQCNGQGE